MLEVGEEVAVTDESEEGSGLEDDMVEVGGEFCPDHPFLVGLRELLMSQNGKGLSQRGVKQISVAVSEFFGSSTGSKTPL